LVSPLPVLNRRLYSVDALRVTIPGPTDRLGNRWPRTGRRGTGAFARLHFCLTRVDPLDPGTHLSGGAHGHRAGADEAHGDKEIAVEASG
jgi:hypothetical protein